VPRRAPRAARRYGEAADSLRREVLTVRGPDRVDRIGANKHNLELARSGHWFGWFGHGFAASVLSHGSHSSSILDASSK
jgi:hypothetical protein